MSAHLLSPDAKALPRPEIFVGEKMFFSVCHFFGVCCSLGKNKAEFLYFHWMCVRGHYLAEKCSFDQDGVEQKGACVGLSG